MASWGIAALVVLVHLATGLWQYSLGYDDLLTSLFLERDGRFRVAVGGQFRTLVADDYHLFRLFTSVLLHGDVVHLLLNAVAIVALGRILEPMVGKMRVLAWFTLGGFAGSVAAQWAGVLQSDGASGGAFALLGAAFVLGLRRRKQWDEEDRLVMGPVMWAFLALNIVLSFAIPFIDAAGHMGGLALGLVAGAVMPWRRQGPFALTLGWWWLVVFTIGCVVGFVFVVVD